MCVEILHLWLLMSMISAFWAGAFEDKIGALHLKVFRQADFRDWDVLQTNGLSAFFAMEMHMHVVVDTVVVAVAEFVAHAVAVFKRMHELLLFEKRQCPEDARLVDAADAVFEFGHRHWAMLPGQGFCHDDSVCRGLDVVSLD